MTDHKCPEGTGFSCPTCNQTIDKETAQNFFEARIVTLLGYATSIILEFKRQGICNKEELQKIKWFTDNVERVIYKKLPLTDAP